MKDFARPEKINSTVHMQKKHCSKLSNKLVNTS